PMYVYWQFPMERLCGMIKFQIKSRTKTNVNIANVQMMIEQTNLLPFVLRDVAVQYGPGSFDKDGCYVLERILARALKKKQKAEQFVAKAMLVDGDWNCNDIFSDKSDSQNGSSDGESMHSSSDEGDGNRK